MVQVLGQHACLQLSCCHQIVSNLEWCLLFADLVACRYMTSSLRDLSSKLDGVESSLSHGGRMAYFSGKKKEESQLSKVARDSTKITLEQVQGLMTQVIKNALFNGVFAETDRMADAHAKH